MSQIRPSSFSIEDLELLKEAKERIVKMSLAARISSFVGTPVEALMDNLPEKWSDKIMTATTTALTKAADVAIFTMKEKETSKSKDFLHKIGVAVTGGVSGAFGLAALLVELPISTTLMVRSIADIARSEGEKLSEVETRLACMEVFALGGPGMGDDGSESGYFAVRTSLNTAMTQLAKNIAEQGIKGSGAPLVVKFISNIAERFSIVITEKAAAQAVPIVGAIGGAAVNTLFISHFQDIARGHFSIRRLERKYGKELVREVYDTIIIE
ncbi:MAG: EcsC family protein [Bacteroidota bacterium]